ncbi:MAG: efflux RND transporter periplasmic adaptor subunit [Planctomycetaceae bacterium]
MWPRSESEQEASGETTVKEPTDSAAPALLAMTREKLSVLDLRVQPVERRTLQQVVTAPGRLAYDDRRHVEVKSATSGVLVDIRVKPGDRVAAGAVVAVISSPEIGTARADVLEREADWKLALEAAGLEAGDMQGSSDWRSRCGRRSRSRRFARSSRECSWGARGRKC